MAEVEEERQEQVPVRVTVGSLSSMMMWTPIQSHCVVSGCLSQNIIAQ